MQLLKEAITMKKKIASLLAVAAVLTAVPAFAVAPDAAVGRPAGYQLSDVGNGDWGCCGRGGRGQGRNGGYCWGNQQQ